MESKEALVENIKEWIKMDSEISRLRQEMKGKANNKKRITESLVKVMKTNDIDCFDIHGGSLIYKKNVVKKPINGKMLLTTLQNYYSSKPEMAEEVSKFILDNREEQVKETIKRKVTKSTA